MWIVIFDLNFNRSLRTISYIIIHNRHLFWYLEPFLSHLELLLLYYILYETTLSLHILFIYLLLRIISRVLYLIMIYLFDFIGVR